MGEGLQPGDVFENRWLIEEEVGRGSFGAVYRCREQGRSEPVAVKVLLPWVEADQEMRHRFKREAKLAQHLVSPHGIRIYEFGETADGTLYLVMEYLQGMPLNVILADEGKIEPARVAHIARQTLVSLAEAHQMGIVHRDLKPPNIFICDNRETPDYVKVFDFGIAKIVGGTKEGSLQETTKLTVRGGLVGTPVYMSPEQCRGEDLTPASDLYSLGVLMYEMLTGDVPFDDTNPVRIMMLHNQQQPPALPPAIGSTLVGKVVMRALEKDTRKRYATAEEMISALDGVEPPMRSGEEAPKKTQGRKPQLMRDIAYRETLSLQVPAELAQKGAPEDDVRKTLPEDVRAKLPSHILQSLGNDPSATPKSNTLLYAIIAGSVLLVLVLAALVVLIVIVMNRTP